MDELDSLDFQNHFDYNPEDLIDLSDGFDIKKVTLFNGVLYLKGTQSSIHIPLEPFLFNNEVVETEITALSIQLPDEIEKISGKFFHFPVKKQTGYVDGSFFFGGVHNTVDIPGISFGPYNREENTIPVIMDCSFLFSHNHEDMDDVHLKLKTVLEVK